MSRPSLTPSLSSSKYSRTGPLFLLIARFVRLTGTTWLAHTYTAKTDNSMIEVNPIMEVVSGKMGSKTSPDGSTTAEVTVTSLADTRKELGSDCRSEIERDFDEGMNPIVINRLMGIN